MRKRLARLLAICVLALLCVAIPAPFLFAANRHSELRTRPALNARLDKVLGSGAAPRGFWGIEVAELSSGRILFSRDAQHLFHPASNMKLFTTAGALEKLGPDFVFRTTVESESGPDAQGRVLDLYLVGRGDPSFCEDISSSLANSGGPTNHPCPTLENPAERVVARAAGIAPDGKTGARVDSEICRNEGGT